MIAHTITPSTTDRPSPYGGLLVEYHCTCGLAFASASGQPECPSYRDHTDGFRAGLRDKRRRRKPRGQPWMSRAYAVGYRKAFGLRPPPALPPEPTTPPEPEDDDEA